MFLLEPDGKVADLGIALLSAAGIAAIVAWLEHLDRARSDDAERSRRTYEAERDRALKESISSMEADRAGRQHKDLKRTLVQLTLMVAPDLVGIRLGGEDLQGLVLRGRDLTSANLRSTVLESADLTGCNLSNADLSGANLAGARLRDVRANGAVFAGACLTGALVDGAVFRDCDFSKAILGDVDFSLAVLEDCDGMP